MTVFRAGDPIRPDRMLEDRRMGVSIVIRPVIFGISLKLDWTLDPGLWTLDSGLWFFFLSKLYPPPQKNLYLPPEKPLYLPHETPPPRINISSPKYSVRVFKQTTLFPPPTSPKKPLCLPLKTAPSQKSPLPSPK